MDPRELLPGARAPVSLADGFDAMGALAPTDQAARDEILELLGLPKRPPAAAADVSPVPEPAPVPKPPAVPPSPLGPPSGVTTPAPAQGPASPVPATMGPPTRQATDPRAWRPAPGPTLPRAREALPAPPPPPIFAALRARGIYTATLSTWVREGDLDVEGAIAERASGQPLAAIPRLPLPTLRRGVQLLLDLGPAMAPFLADVRHLEVELATLFGEGQIQRLYFSRCPTRKVREEQRAPRKAWQAPPRGVPVLVASEFGIAGGTADEEAASVAEWARFVQDVRAEGHRLVGLVPFGPARWPPALAESMTFVHWSEHTTAASVHRAVREAQGGRR
jgi:hypothetical protein